MSTHNIPLSINKKITQNYPKPAAVGFFSRGLKNNFEIAVVNEPSVFEPLDVYYMKDTKQNKTPKKQGWAANPTPGIYQWHLPVFTGLENTPQVANTGKYWQIELFCLKILQKS